MYHEQQLEENLFLNHVLTVLPSQELENNGKIMYAKYKTSSAPGKVHKRFQLSVSISNK